MDRLPLLRTPVALLLGLALSAIAGIGSGCSGNPAPQSIGPGEPLIPADPGVSRAHPTYPLVAASSQPAPHGSPEDTWFDFQNRSPLEFLEWVAFKGSPEEIEEARRSRSRVLVFSEIHQGWIRESDLPALVAMVADRRPALSWMLSTCSIFPHLPQTVGEHAAAMVLAYRSELSGTVYGGYPPSLNSDHVGKPQFAVEWATARIAESGDR